MVSVPSTPLQPFQNPLDTLARFGISLPRGGFLAAALVIVFGIWALYTLVVIYHWFKYSHGSLATYPAVITHLAVSGALISYAVIASVALFS